MEPSQSDLVWLSFTVQTGTVAGIVNVAGMDEMLAVHKDHIQLNVHSHLTQLTIDWLHRNSG